MERLFVCDQRPRPPSLPRWTDDACPHGPHTLRLASVPRDSVFCREGRTHANACAGLAGAPAACSTLRARRHPPVCPQARCDCRRQGAPQHATHFFVVGSSTTPTPYLRPNSARVIGYRSISRTCALPSLSLSGERSTSASHPFSAPSAKHCDFRSPSGSGCRTPADIHSRRFCGATEAQTSRLAASEPP